MGNVKTNNTHVVNSLIDAVVASGKRFVEIPQRTIFEFFDREGLPRAMWDEVYNKVKSSFETNKSKTIEPTIKVVDYSDSSHNEVKVRQPRKTVFSEITKIAG